jgi:hypothetical protein
MMMLNRSGFLKIPDFQFSIFNVHPRLLSEFGFM